MDHCWGYGSDQRLRDENQDHFGVFELSDVTLAVVCDGMGGHAGGAHASRIAVRSIYESFNDGASESLTARMENALIEANAAIHAAARRNHQLLGMGTTAVVAAISGNECVVGHVGDSRAYLINGHELVQLSRDHTMVNLFVDADLLSEKDAATHPEAHVLSRSLGVEPQTEPEVRESFELAPHDVVLLCSDGVHGVLQDNEILKPKWSAPHAAVGTLLERIRVLEGDDNATIVAIYMGTAIEDVPATPPPKPEAVEDGTTTHSATVVPFDEEVPIGVTPATASSAEGHAWNVTPSTASSPPFEEVVIDGRTPPIPENVARPPAPGTQLSTRRNAPARWIPLALIAAIAAVVMFPDSEPTGQNPTEDAEDNTSTIVIQEAFREPVEVPSDDKTLEADPNESTALFQPELPAPPPRAPHRARFANQPPPGGSLQYEAIDAARREQCAESLQKVAEGMAKSKDHASLYKHVWFCFNNTHQRPLMYATAHTWADFRPLSRFFVGTESQNDEYHRGTPGRTPAWFRMPADGIEHRLRMFDTDAPLVGAAIDIFGEPTLADHLARDMHMIALAAHGLAVMPRGSHTDASTTAWAQRVYTLAWAMNHEPGRLVRAHRPELAPALEQLLNEATAPAFPDGTPREIPATVQEALDVGIGRRPRPTDRPVKPRGPAPIIEPDLGSDDDGVQVQRAGKPNFTGTKEDGAR